VLAGCEDETQQAKERDAGTESDGGINQGIDTEFAKAVIAAATGAPGASGAPSQGPPPGGVFLAGEAEKAIPADSPPTLELLDAGAEPRVTLTTKAAAPVMVRMSIGSMQPPTVMPTVQYTLEVSVLQPAAADEKKADAKPAQPKPAAPKAAKGKTGLGEPTHPSGGAMLVADVVHAGLAAQQMTKIPEEYAKRFETLKGSRMVAAWNSNGTFSDPKVDIAEGADKEAAGALASVGDGLQVAMWPVPGKPVGVGAYWMVSERAAYGPLSVLRYRIIRVEKTGAGGVEFSTELSQYTTEEALQSVLPQGIQVGGFESKAKGTGTRALNTWLPEATEITVPAKLMLVQGTQVKPQQFVVSVTVEPAITDDGAEAPPKKK